MEILHRPALTYCPIKRLIDVRISGILVTIDSNSKHAESIKRIQVREETNNEDLGYDSDDGKMELLNGF